MLGKLLDFSNQYELIKEKDYIIAGISGGADSMCLLLFLEEIKKCLSIEIQVVHVNHLIRKDTADRDERYVLEYCEEHEIACSSYHINIKELARNNKLTIEEAGRVARYECFEKEKEKALKKGIPAEKIKIAVAHHENDQAETVLFHMARGTGLKGLCGMRPSSNGVIRPLLCVSKKEIVDFLEVENVKYLHDETNDDNEYSRNRIRNLLFPMMEETINVRAAEHIGELPFRLWEIQEYLETEGKKAFEECLIWAENKGDTRALSLDRKHFLTMQDALQSQIMMIAIERVVNHTKDFSFRHFDQIKKLAAGQSGKHIELPDELEVSVSFEQIRFEKKRTNQSYSKEEYKIDLKEIPNCSEKIIEVDEEAKVIFTSFNFEKTMVIPENTYTKWFDYDKILGSLSLRNRKKGDFLTINEKNDHKKISDYMKDEKIDSSIRDRILVLAERDHILWIPGGRISHRYKVDKDTKKILQVQVTGGQKQWLIKSESC